MSAPTPDLQDLCDRGQRLLVETDYLAAEAALSDADRAATAAGDFDTLSRLYLPLQEARRQRRQRCGEGVVRLDLIAAGPDDPIDPRRVIDAHPHGQLLVAGWASIAASLELRRLAAERRIYVETYLAAVYPVGGGRIVVIAPTADVALPPADVAADGNVEALIRRLPPFAVTLDATDVPAGPRRGSDATFAETMALWERLAAPFLAAADATADPRRRIDAYRRTIEVDYAAEKAHQRLSAAAAQVARSGVGDERRP